jgi:hypothetical protein
VGPGSSGLGEQDAGSDQSRTQNLRRRSHGVLVLLERWRGAFLQAGKLHGRRVIMAGAGLMWLLRGVMRSARTAVWCSRVLKDSS